MKEFSVITEVPYGIVRRNGLSGIRDTIREDIHRKIASDLMDQLHNLIQIEQYTDPMTGIMKIRGSLRVAESGDCFPYHFRAFELPNHTLAPIKDCR